MTVGEIDLLLEWSAYERQRPSSLPDSVADYAGSNLDGHRLTLEWSAVADLRVADDPADDEYPPIERVSFTMPAPTFDDVPGVPDQPWNPTEPVSVPVGRLHLVIGGQNWTYFRDQRFIPLDDAQAEPFGDAEASFRFPALTDFDDRQALGITPLAPVRFFLRDMDGNDHTLYEGCVSADQPDDRYTDETTPGGVVECVGAGLRLDLLREPPPLNVTAHDYGQLIADTINRKKHAHGLNIGVMPQRHVGVKGVRKGDFSPVLTGTVQDYLADLQVQDDLWTVKLARPRTLKLVVKDTTTVDVTITYAQPGAECELTTDHTTGTTGVYGTGSKGREAWMGARFPNLVDGDAPTFPLGVGGTFVAGDGQHGFAPFSAFLRRGDYGQIDSNDTYLASDVGNVEAFQDDAGVTVNGVVGAQSWEAAFQPGANQGTVRGAYVAAAYAKPATRKHLHNAQGARTGPNPGFDLSVPRVDDFVPFGDGISKAVGKKSAKQIVDRAYPAGLSGTITLTGDPEEMSRFLIDAGMNIKVKHFRGSSPVLHITRRERNWLTGEVTLTVDEKAQDELTRAAIEARSKEVADLTKRRIPRRRSHVFNDYGQVLAGDGAGYLPIMFQEAGKWNVQRVPAAPSGTIERVTLAFGTGLTESILTDCLNDNPPDEIPGAARGCVLITGQPIHPRQITRMDGLDDPLHNLDNGDNPWETNSRRLSRHFEMVFQAGGPGQALGFYPHNDPGDGSDTNLSGVFNDGGGWTYGPTEHWWLWVAIYSPVDCKVGGRIYPGAPQ